MPMNFDFNDFINLRNRLRLQSFYTETPKRIDLYMFLEGQVLTTSITIAEIQEKFGKSKHVMELFRATYLIGSVKFNSMEIGAAIAKDIKIEVDSSKLKEILDSFLHDLSHKLTTTTTGGEGTPGYALIPVQMGSGKVRRCMSCGNILLSGETRCPACGSTKLSSKEADGSEVELSMRKWVGFDFEGDIKYILEFLKTYDFGQITTLTEKKKKKLKEFLIQSIMEGWSVNKLEKEVETITKDENSARMISRSELIRCANEGTLLHYEDKGIEKVKWIATPSSPGGRTCKRCLEMNGKILLLKDAKGKIPLHPYCRCCYSAVIE